MTEGQYARTASTNLGSLSLPLVIGLLPIYFLVFAGLAYRNDHVPVSHNQAEWLLQAAKFVRL